MSEPRTTGQPTRGERDMQHSTRSAVILPKPPLVMSIGFLGSPEQREAVQAGPGATVAPAVALLKAPPQTTVCFDFDKRVIRHDEKVALTEDGAG
jgi:hypothetical protein